MSPAMEFRVLRLVVNAARWCLRSLRVLPAVGVVGAVGVWTFARAELVWNADGDPALHLALIKQIAMTHRLPSSLPHLAARVGEGGTVEATFPFAYTPLYHATGAVAYAVAGVDGVLLINALSASMIAYVIFRFVGRRVIWPIAALAGFAAFASPHVQTPFAGVYMEPLELGLFFGGAWFTYLAFATRRARLGAAAGLLLGLSVGVRQSALLYVGVLGVVVVWCLCARGSWRPKRMLRELYWLAVLVGTLSLVAAPPLLFLALRSGGVGYGDLMIFKTGGGPAIDPAANAYIASITKPSSSPAVWLSRYARTLFFGSSALPQGMQLFILLPAAAGILQLDSRGGASRFFARWVSLQLLAETILFATVHGNSRYIILSQMLFYSVVPVGVYASARWLLTRTVKRLRVAMVALPVALTIGTGVAMFPPGYFNVFTNWADRDYRTFRGDTYAQMGIWVNANTPADALFLTPRTYTAELTWDRDVTWITFYGNAWVVDAISTGDPAEANRILVSHGVDYVLIADPPGSYVDRMPEDGMRSYLQLNLPDSRYFTFVHATERQEPYEFRSREVTNALRLYRVEPQAKPP